MTRTPTLVLIALSMIGLYGCAPERPSPQAHRTAVGGLPAISRYYEQATAPHYRAVRKPVRDERAEALRNLSREVEAVLAESRTWDSDVRLAALVEPEQSAARGAVAEFRASLNDLHAAAAMSDMTGLRRQYARVMACSRHLSEVPAIGE